IPMLNAVIARIGMNSLNKRMGDLRDMNNPARNQGIWLRTYYKDMTVSDLLKTDMSLFGVEAGYDWLINPDEPNKVYLGVMLGYVNANDIKTKTNIGNNKGSGDAPSVGIYATIINDNNWFIDFAARNFWSKIENTTQTSLNTLSFDVKRNLFTASVEAGKTILSDNGLKVEPKAELSYIRANADTTNVVNGTGDLKYSAETYLTGKAAIMFSYQAQMSNQLLIEPLLELAYNYEFDGKGKVSYGGAETETSLKGGYLEVDAGVNAQLTKDIYLYALGSYEKGSKIDGFGLHAGIRAAFGGGDKKKKKEEEIKETISSQQRKYIIKYHALPEVQYQQLQQQQEAVAKETLVYPKQEDTTYENKVQKTELTEQPKQRIYKFTKPRKFKIK
ncbi:MAG: autotransporter outer membrane beta-barrel domain-containing protein, partial [Elusimicrobiaceae bacterium]|nr:autotransporter outer membrane beta-barrel domain-containing protein [Elusimicrobiaceae bacterium]